MQLVNLPSFYRQLCLVVDSALSITLVDSKTWSDLDGPKLQPTKRVLGAFEGKAIHTMGYFCMIITQGSQKQINSHVTYLYHIAYVLFPTSPHFKHLYGIRSTNKCYTKANGD